MPTRIAIDDEGYSLVCKVYDGDHVDDGGCLCIYMYNPLGNRITHWGI